jgi:hypothetical protein
MWISLASGVLAATFLWLTFLLLRHSHEVGVERSIHQRVRLSRRLTNLVLGCAAVAVAGVALQAGVLLHSLDQRARPLADINRAVTLQFDPQLRSVPSQPAAPTVAAVDELALSGTAR